MYQELKKFWGWRRRLFCVVVLTTLAIASGLALGQSAPQTKPAQESQKPTVQEPQKQDETLKLTSRLVLVPVSATDAAGQPVKDLKVEDLVIEEDGRPQQVVALGEPGKTPIDLSLLVDVSGSTHSQ